MLGEAAMMTAQVTGSNKLKFGMNREGNDDKQLALNLDFVHYVMQALAPASHNEQSRSHFPMS